MPQHWIKQNKLYGGSINEDAADNEKKLVAELQQIIEKPANKEMVKLRKAPPKSVPINTRQLLKSIN